MASESSRGCGAGEEESRGGNPPPARGEAQVLYRAEEGQKVAGGGTVGLGGVLLEGRGPFLAQRASRTSFPI